MITIALILGRTPPAPIPAAHVRHIRHEMAPPAAAVICAAEQRRAEILAWLKANPESTVAEVAEWAGIPLKAALSDLRTLYRANLAAPTLKVLSRNGSSLCWAWSATT